MRINFERKKFLTQKKNCSSCISFGCLYFSSGGKEIDCPSRYTTTCGTSFEYYLSFYQKAEPINTFQLSRAESKIMMSLHYCLFFLVLMIPRKLVFLFLIYTHNQRTVVAVIVLFLFENNKKHERRIEFNGKFCAFAYM